MNVIINSGREKSLLRRHPWIFASAIKSVDAEPASGGTVDLLSSEGHFLARASYSPISQIRARAWTFNDEPVDKEFFRKRIRAAIDMRYSIFDTSDSMRLIHAESDGIPGLIVDRYNDILVLQSLTAGSEFWKEIIADILVEDSIILELKTVEFISKYEKAKTTKPDVTSKVATRQGTISVINIFLTGK